MTIVLLTITAAPAIALPSKSSKQAEARAVKAQIDALDTKVEQAAERYNEASEKHGKLVEQRDAAKAKRDKAIKRIDYLQSHLRGRAKEMYRTGPLQFLEVLLDAKDFEQFTTTWDVLREVNNADAESVAELKVVRAEAAAAHKELSEKEKAAKEQVRIMANNKASIESDLAERKSKLRGIEAEIAAIQAAEEAAARRRAAAAAAAAAAAEVSSSGSSGGGGGGGRSFPPPTRAPRSEVVNIAKRYLGAPYRWGATGPNSFDCSGFTTFVYRQVGVSLPRVSRAQIGAGQRVSRSDLQPGDLVFFGSPIHHVGIYVGGGQMIHSPRTGDVVKYSSIGRGDYAGACRP